MAFVPYCGSPPVPGSEIWNFEPRLVGALLGALGAWALLRSRHPSSRRDDAMFLGGWLFLAAAFVSPLCNISVALFSARALQHMILTLVAAPLLMRGLLGCEAWRRPVSGLSAMACAIAFTALFWFWHSPRAYDGTLENNLVYWAMHLSLFGAALAFWAAVLRSPGLIAFSLVSAIGLQMSMLGALLSFAREPLYIVHALTTGPWGLSALQDQQLGGLVMWVPAGLLLALYSTLALATYLRRVEGEQSPPRLAVVE